MTTHYPWKTIDPKDAITIEATSTLSLNDVHVLTRLYQPLIGHAAYALYQVLFAEVSFQPNQKQRSVAQLLTKLDIGIPEFYQARIRLEGIGLLRVFRTESATRDYFYELVTPLSATSFFKDSLLRTLLVEKIGNRLFQEEVESLLPVHATKTGYEETTRSFLDVYHVDFQNNHALTETDFMPVETSERPKLAKTVEHTDSFDYKLFLAGLSKNFINKESLTSEVKELIYTFHTVYGIDELTMQSLILESSDVESGQINKNKFVQNVQQNFSNKQKIKVKAPLEMMETVEIDDRGFSQGERIIIQHAKETPPADYLSSIKEQKGGFVTSNEQWVLKELVQQSPLSKEVINILINYVLVAKENPVLEKNYSMKLANDWAIKNVRTAEDAMAKLKEIYTQPRKAMAKPANTYKNNYRPNKKADAKLPDWAKKDANPSAQTDELVSQEESESLQERLERLRKLRPQKEDN